MSAHTDQQLVLHLHRPAHNRHNFRPSTQLRRTCRPGGHPTLPINPRRARRDARARPHCRVRQRERAELQAGAPALVRAHDPVPCGERGGRDEDHADDEVRAGRKHVFCWGRLLMFARAVVRTSGTEPKVCRRTSVTYPRSLKNCIRSSITWKEAAKTPTPWASFCAKSFRNCRTCGWRRTSTGSKSHE